MNLIILSDFHVPSHKHYINALSIITFSKDSIDNFTTVTLVENKYRHVIESPDEIANLIEDAYTI